jgi:uncharacterized protein (DUF488 family)
VARPFFTIGHSTRSIEEFINLLEQVEVRLVVDVRTIPRSASNPQYNADVLPKSLSGYGVRYAHIGALGGLRGHARNIAPSVNAFWENESFHNYADYAMSSRFRAGLSELRRLGHARRCAVMCAEAMWWRCHRRIIADYLIFAGETVFHILGVGRIDAARPTSGARAEPEGILTYPGSRSEGG